MAAMTSSSMMGGEGEIYAGLAKAVDVSVKPTSCIEAKSICCAAAYYRFPSHSWHYEPLQVCLATHPTEGPLGSLSIQQHSCHLNTESHAVMMMCFETCPAAT